MREGAPRLERGLLELGVPVMGICYGMQLLVHELGGRVEQAEVGEFGRSDLTVTEPGTLLKGMPKEQTCWMCHRDTVFEPPPGFTALASSSASPVAAVEDAERGIYGIQFHPEVVHTPYGQEILTRFLTEVCGCERTWSAASIVEDQIARIRRQVGRREGDLRAVGRRRLLGGGAARAPRGGGPADVRVRRPRADAQGRGRAGGERVQGHVQGPARGRRRGGEVPGEAEGRDRARGQAQGDRRGVHQGVRGGGGEAAERAREAVSWCRARCTRT